MNLDDLRAQLQNQANEIDPATPVPLPTIRRRTQTIKRRRAAAIITSAAAAVVLVVGVLPNTLNNSAPDPAKPPADVTRDGITLPGTVGADRLEKAEIGKPGGGPLEFRWTPSSTTITFRPYCRTTGTKPLDVKVTVNGRVVVAESCDDSGPSPVHEGSDPSGHLLWAEAPPGEAAEVRVSVVDRETNLEVTNAAQLALGIYRAPEDAPRSESPARAGLPVRSRPPGPGDYVKDGIRYRANAAGDSLLGAAIGDTGQRTLRLRFTATDTSAHLRLLCTARRVAARPTASLSVQIDGAPVEGPPSCLNSKADVADEDPVTTWIVRTTPGRTVEVTLELKEQATADPGVRLGVGAYSPAPERKVRANGATIPVDEVIEHGGYTYKLAKIVTGEAAGGRPLSLDTPGGTPFIIGYDSAGQEEPIGRRGQAVMAEVDGLEGLVSFRLGGLRPLRPTKILGAYGQPARDPGKVSAKVVKGTATKGAVLVLALYLPE